MAVESKRGPSGRCASLRMTKFVGAGRKAWAGEPMRLLLISIVLLACFGCKEPATWSAESRSPDGTWIARAETVEYSGFGTGGVETTVSIRRASGSGSSQRVLAFAQGGAALGLNMHWDSPSRLVVVYRANPELLYYQVVKTSGVDISVQNASPNPVEEYRPSAGP
jgi:hypothetical protein